MPNVLNFIQTDPLLVALVAIFWLGVALIIIIVLLFQERQKYRKIINNNSFEEIKKQNASLLHNTLSKAQNIIEKAEEEGEKIVENSKLAVEKYESFYESQFGQQSQTAQDALNRYLADLRVQSEKAQLASSDYTKERVNAVLERFEKNLEAELQASRQLIEDYKKQQLASVDENVVAVLEKILNLVLVKKISLKDQMDLIYEALEKAKAEKFIV